MKSPLLALICLNCIQAQPTPEKEHVLPNEAIRLQQLYQQNVAKAVQPLRERYLSELKRLLEQATRSGDLDGAMAIAKEIKSLNDDLLAASDTIDAFEKRILGTTWRWKNEFDVELKRDAFVPNVGNFEWRITRPYGIKYTFPRSKTRGVITFSRDLTSATVDETLPDGRMVTFKLTRKLQ